MAFPVQLMDLKVVLDMFLGHVEGSLDLATVGVTPSTAEEGSEQSNAVAVNGTIEGDGDHLGD